MNRYRTIITAGTALLATVTGCAMPAVQQQLPAKPAPTAPRFSHTDPADDCAPGVIVVESGEDTPCDLVGARNTLTVIDVDQAYCDQHGGKWTALPIAGECANVDF